MDNKDNIEKKESQDLPAKQTTQEDISIILENGTFKFGGMNDIFKFSNKIAKSELIPKDFRNKPADIAICISKGLEFGLSPFFALENIAVINGRTTLWGDGLMALVKKSGQLEYQESKYEGTQMADDWKCIFTVKRKGEEKAVSREFSWTEAKTAGLVGRNVWKSYPKRMMMQRARSYALRDCFPDILGGLYSAEEMRDSEIINVTPVKKTVKTIDATDYSQVDNSGM